MKQRIGLSVWGSWERKEGAEGGKILAAHFGQIVPASVGWQGIWSKKFTFWQDPQRKGAAYLYARILR